MKQKLFSLLLSASLVVFFACSDDESKPKSNFKVNGKSYSLTEGDYWTNESGDYTTYYISLWGEGTSQYSWAEFNLISTGETLAEGTYSYDDETMWGAEIGVESLEGDSFSYESLESGQVVVTKSGDTFTFTFTFVLDGEEVTGRYKGKIEEVQ